jgi:HEAT repeat protein
MAFAFDTLSRTGPAEILLKAIVVCVAGISVLLSFIVLRRWLRARYFARRDRQIVYTRQHWDELIGAPPAWRFDPLASEVMETLLLDSIEVSQGEELARLVECLRRSGLLDKRIREARSRKRWRRRKALVMLGRTRAAEAIPALTDALDASDMETRIAAVRGMGKLALPEAAVPMLLLFCQERLSVPWTVLKNALWACCSPNPAVLLPHLRAAAGLPRELLARVLAEIADPSMGDELLLLAGDRSSEIRAAAARAFVRVDPQLALPPLSYLVTDGEWFVRLRAVIALGFLGIAEAVPLLIRSLSDRHRQVRQRAAWGLMRSAQDMPEILRAVVQAGDNYGLQVMVAELERCARFVPLLERMRHSGDGRLVSALVDARAKLGLSKELTQPQYVSVP